MVALRCTVHCGGSHARPADPRSHRRRNGGARRRSRRRSRPQAAGAAHRRRLDVPDLLRRPVHQRAGTGRHAACAVGVRGDRRADRGGRGGRGCCPAQAASRLAAQARTTGAVVLRLVRDWAGRPDRRRAVVGRARGDRLDGGQRGDRTGRGVIVGPAGTASRRRTRATGSARRPPRHRPSRRAPDLPTPRAAAGDWPPGRAAR